MNSNKGGQIKSDFKFGELPSSLTSLTLSENYKGIILNGSIPKSITSLNYQFDSNHNSIKLIPNSIARVANSKSIPGMIPHNVTSLKFSGCEDSEIEANSLPISIKTLDLGKLKTANKLKDILPPNITNLILRSCSDYQQLPKSIETLNICTLESTSINAFSGFKHLTSLDIRAPEHLPDGIFPNSLTNLTLICENLQLTNNLLPKNLKVLELKHFDQPLNKF
ncbi:hypothetical protein ACTFIY_011676 [Dictyostelium cf. discoideum]